MIASSALERRSSSAAPDSMRATSAKGLTVERIVTTTVGSPIARSTSSAALDLDDVAAVPALDEPPRRTSTSTGAGTRTRVARGHPRRRVVARAVGAGMAVWVTPAMVSRDRPGARARESARPHAG